MKYKPIYKRARTSEQKRCIIENLLKLWDKTYDIRLGQLLSNTFGEQLFNVEDYDLLGHLEIAIKDYIPNKMIVRAKKIFEQGTKGEKAIKDYVKQLKNWEID